MSHGENGLNQYFAIGLMAGCLDDDIQDAKMNSVQTKDFNFIMLTTPECPTIDETANFLPHTE
jgi:hypothetical protein